MIPPSTRFLLLVVIICLKSNFSLAQDTTFVQRSMSIVQTTGPITIDGELNEEAWTQAALQDDFWEAAPEDGRKARLKTEVKVLYSSEGIYIGATLYDDNGQVITSLKRDKFGGDGFVVVIDPLAQKTNGFAFAVTAGGAQTEILLSTNSGDDSWNNRWRSATKVFQDRWAAEFFIPFKTLRFDKGNLEWGINFVRFEPGLNEAHVWSPVPRQFDPGDMGYCGKLVWDNVPAKQKRNATLIPYSTVRTSNDFSREGSKKTSLDVGGDAKVSLTTGLNLDLTVNPDFSQVEVDALVTNLSRFNIFFPERRQFFLENADLFGDYGQFANQPFYSRRIGLDPSGSTVPILYGARLTGNITEKLRIGAFNMHSKTTDAALGQNFTSLATQYRIGKRSNIKGLFLNRQAYDGSESVDGNFGRNLGGEINLSTENGKWSGQGGYIQSFKENVQNKNKHIYGRFDYSGEKFRTFLFVQNIGENYFADMGFNARVNNFNPTTGEVVRIGYTQIGNMLNYFIYPKSEKINFHWSGIENFIIINNGGLLNDWYTRFRHFIFFQNTSQLRFRLNHSFQDLVFPFALTETPLPAGQYDNWEFNVQLNSDTRKDINFSLFSIYGGFYNGNKFTNTLDVNFRRQPWGNFSLGFENNRIRLPEPYGDLDITLLTARAEVNFSTSLFWTTFFQYNTQANRMNINTRFQWRYAPMSDIFLVYTDNYLTLDRLSPTGRSLVLKVNYWLGI